MGNDVTLAPGVSKTSTVKSIISSVSHWPPLVWIFLALITGSVWVMGTSVQIWTSENWMLTAVGMQSSLMETPFSVFGQFLSFWNGGLTQPQVVSQTFGWSVQLALICFSFGVELPRNNQKAILRARIFFSISLFLVGINCIGDAIYASNFGFWGSTGFAVALGFVTFCCGLAMIACLQQAYSSWKTQQ